MLFAEVLIATHRCRILLWVPKKQKNNHELIVFILLMGQITFKEVDQFKLNLISHNSYLKIKAKVF